MAVRRVPAPHRHRPSGAPLSLTADGPADGLVIWQPERGFRYGSEAFWLVGFALEGGTPTRALDLGTGSGVIAFLLARLGIAAVGVDVMAAWEPCWHRSLADSRPPLPELRIADVADGVPGSFDLVVSNPPFYAAGSGPIAADAWKAARAHRVQRDPG